MRFDDTLGTVLAVDLTAPASAQAAWRQVVDLIGRGRAPADDGAIAVLEEIGPRVPVAVRAASARALSGARPPLALIRLLACDDIAVAAPILRSVDLAVDDWVALLPALSPTARAVLRHRRDLPNTVVRGLASFGAVDFVIGVDPAGEPAPAPAQTVPPDAAPRERDAGPFLSVGSIALGLPMVAEALRRGNDGEPSVGVGDGGTFRIADVVARLEAFQRRKDHAPPPPAPAAAPAGFRFATDAAGMIRWVDGVARGALIGMGLARQARPAEAGVDGVASGAFRRRARFADARMIDSLGDSAGTWLVSAAPVFDPATGRFVGYQGSGRRPRRHERAEAVAASDSLRQLVHELRTPAGAIAGFSEMIEHQLLGPVDDPHRDQAIAMRHDARGLLAAIDDLDTVARIDTGALRLRPEPVALAPLLTRVAGDLLALTTARGVRLMVADTACTILADPRALERLTARVLGAMIGAGAAGETIAVRAFDGVGSRIGLAVTRPAALDTHPGEAVLRIDDEDSPASLLGTGFALRLARNLAREIGGALAIGHRHVTLYLPAVAEHARPLARTS